MNAKWIRQTLIIIRGKVLFPKKSFGMFSLHENKIKSQKTKKQNDKKTRRWQQYTSIHVYPRIVFLTCSTSTLYDNRPILYASQIAFLCMHIRVLRRNINDSSISKKDRESPILIIVCNTLKSNILSSPLLFIYNLCPSPPFFLFFSSPGRNSVW